jgi:hypothetical protein
MKREVKVVIIALALAALSMPAFAASGATGTAGGTKEWVQTPSDYANNMGLEQSGNQLQLYGVSKSITAQVEKEKRMEGLASKDKGSDKGIVPDHASSTGMGKGGTT